MENDEVVRPVPAADMTVPADLTGRIEWLEARYFRNQRDEAFQECLREIMAVDAAGMLLPRPVRSPLNGETLGMRVIGASGDGKSVMIRRNIMSLPGFAEMTDGTEGNYIHITVSPEATIKSLASDILVATGYERLENKVKSHEAWAVVRHRLQMMGIGLLWIDEAHHLLRGGAGRDTVSALQTLKNLLQGPGAVAVLLSGVPDLEQRLSKDAETFRRYQLQLRLRPVVAGQAEIRRLERFLERCCALLELDWPSDPSFVERIVFSQREGLGKSITFAKALIRRALITGKPGLTLADARQRWVLNGGNEDGRSPFDTGDWQPLHKVLHAQAEVD